MRTKPDHIAATRRLILDTLSVGRAIAMRGSKIYNVVRAQLEYEYHPDFFETDLCYLRERNMLRVNAELSGPRAGRLAPAQFGPQWHMNLYWELTPDGSDIANGITVDPRLEG